MEYSDNILKTTYLLKDGYKVIDSGSVVIEGIEHVVFNGFVKCNSSLNSISFNTTLKNEVCEKCFPDKLSFQRPTKLMKVEQLKLF